MWSLYNEGKFLEPLRFSNGKTQEDVVKEVVDAIESGSRIIFILGMCGTGKSAIALNIARNLGKTSVVVPGKNLQNQYKKDYENGKYLLKDNNEKLNINVITGRNNHECRFLKDSQEVIPRTLKETNSRLNDIFANKREEIDRKKKENKSADNAEIPCKIEIKEKNFRKIKEYLKENRNINPANIQKTSDVKRLPLASVCPYWSPVLPDKYELKNINYTDKRSYEGLGGTTFNIYQRRPGCKFYEQFHSYIDSDVIVFNSLKYKLESAINRKPLTEAEIIDECDEFLDSFTNQRNINIDRLQNSLIQMAGIAENSEEVLEEINGIINHMRTDSRVNNSVNSGNIVPLKETGLFDIFRIFLDDEDLVKEIDEESYLFEVEETARMFEDFFDETYIIFSKGDNNLTANVVTTNLAKKVKEMADKNKFLIFMSGTLHSDNVLRNVFGLDDFKIIEAETDEPGKIDVVRTGKEFDCSHRNFSNRNFSRSDYLKSLNESVRIARKPVLVHVSAFNDLPSEWEKMDLGLGNLMTRDELKETQNEDKEGKEIEKFKNEEIDVLFTTRCARGVDFPGEQCRSIVFTKYPNPNPEDPFWKILRETKPMNYWEFYKDKARRELFQKLYRGLRFKEDHVNVLSPDTRVLDVFDEKS